MAIYTIQSTLHYCVRRFHWWLSTRWSCQSVSQSGCTALTRSSLGVYSSLPMNLALALQLIIVRHCAYCLSLRPSVRPLVCLSRTGCQLESKNPQKNQNCCECFPRPELPVCSKGQGHRTSETSRKWHMSISHNRGAGCPYSLHACCK